ncbi:MAG: hypothetical protein LBU70_07860 [Chitinispirillales bacterium]|nr:hypothetical protein [Chitinispirillales bacterium]
MSLIKIEREEVLFIKYNGESASDPEDLKKVLQAETAAKNNRDTVIELVNSTVIYSSEIGVLVQFLKTVIGTKNTLRLVASSYVCEMLKTMNIHRIPNLALHDSLELAQEHFPSVDLSSL